MLYLYAVIEPPDDLPPELRGLEGRPVELHRSGQVVAAFSRHPSGSLRAAADNVWAHERVIEALMQRVAVLPSRFGISLSDDGQLESALHHHHDQLAAGLQKVRGCVELGVRVLWRSEGSGDTSPAPRDTSETHGSPPAASGRQYMLARLAEEQERRRRQQNAEELAEALHRPLAVLARQSMQQVLAAPQLVLAGAYLVERGRVETFRRRVQHLAHDRPNLRVLCTGPWPPYHFTPAINAKEVEHVRA